MYEKCIKNTLFSNHKQDHSWKISSKSVGTINYGEKCSLKKVLDPILCHSAGRFHCQLSIYTHISLVCLLLSLLFFLLSLTVHTDEWQMSGVSQQVNCSSCKLLQITAGHTCKTPNPSVNSQYTHRGKSSKMFFLGREKNCGDEKSGFSEQIHLCLSVYVFIATLAKEDLKVFCLLLMMW